VLGKDAEYEAEHRGASAVVPDLPANVLDSFVDPCVIFQPAIDDAGAVIDLIYRDVNTAACAYLKLARAEVVGSAVSQRFDPRGASVLFGWTQQAMRKAEPVALDDVAIDSLVDGQRRWVDIRLAHTSAGLVVSWRDNTPRHIEAQRRAESEERYRMLAENSTDVVLRTGTDGTIDWVSPSATEILGYQPEQLIGLRVPDLMHPHDLSKLLVRRQALMGSHSDGADFQSRIRAADGSWLWMSGVGRALRDNEGTIIGGIDALRDVQAQHDATVALEESEAHFRMLATHAGDVVAQLTADGRLSWISPSVESMLHRRSTDLLGRSVTELVHPNDRSDLSKELTRLAWGDSTPALTIRVETGEGRHRWVEATLHPVGTAVGTGRTMVLRLRDVDAQVRAFRDLSRSERRFRMAMQSAPIGMMLEDLTGHLVETNPALSALLGQEREWLRARRVTDLVHPQDEETLAEMHDEVFSGRADSVGRELRLLRADHSTVWVDFALAIVRDENWEPLSLVGQVLDITEARQARTALEHLADHDSLTGTRNRRSFHATLARTLRASADSGHRVCVLYADLDGLKRINDDFGHAAGDALISAVARRFSRVLRSTDILGRIGGDEFAAVLSPVSDPSEALDLAERVLTEVGQPVGIDDHTVVPSLSMGLACSELEDEPETILRRADAALYRAKRTGGHRVEQ
jgi:diguanylate cyclase (GGDEF)-like protein/PAS domain S-box-containing protein